MAWEWERYSGKCNNVNVVQWKKKEKKQMNLRILSCCLEDF